MSAGSGWGKESVLKKFRQRPVVLTELEASWAPRRRCWCWKMLMPMLPSFLGSAAPCLALLDRIIAKNGRRKRGGGARAHCVRGAARSYSRNNELRSPLHAWVHRHEKRPRISSIWGPRVSSAANPWRPPWPPSAMAHGWESCKTYLGISLFTGVAFSAKVGTRWRNAARITVRACE